MKYRFLYLALAVVGSLLYINEAQAFSVNTGASVYLSNNEAIDGNYYAAGQSVVVDGEVNGDIICAGQNIIINGDVNGDIICAGQAITINGQVKGNIRLLGNVINIGGTIERNLMAFGTTINLTQNSIIGGDALVGTASLEMRGDIGGELHGGARYANIDGFVGKNINIKISSESKNKNGNYGRLTLGENAFVGGAVFYYGHEEVKVINAGHITGEITRLDKKDDFKISSASVAGFVWSKSISLLGNLLLAMVLVFLFKTRLNKIIEPMKNKKGWSFGVGFGVLIIVPIISGLIMLTIFGIKTSLLLGLCWLLAIAIANVFTAMVIGEWVWLKFIKKPILNQYSFTGLGVLIVYTLFAIPFLGGLLMFVGMIWGVGGISIAIFNMIKGNN